ncbi:hypothetical protein FB451DRAFT_1567054 [Mycena latifolia]|nr:hypothetical protein FB451DRAFT_1567054 [Mycena latifolia]
MQICSGIDRLVIIGSLQLFNCVTERTYNYHDCGGQTTGTPASHTPHTKRELLADTPDRPACGVGGNGYRSSDPPTRRDTWRRPPRLSPSDNGLCRTPTSVRVPAKCDLASSKPECDVPSRPSQIRRDRLGGPQGSGQRAGDFGRLCRRTLVIGSTLWPGLSDLWPSDADSRERVPGPPATNHQPFELQTLPEHRRPGGRRLQPQTPPP